MRTSAQSRQLLRSRLHCRQDPDPRRVLVVDDEESIRLLVGYTLQQAGYTVLEADSARAAVRTWSEQPESIDMLLTDIRMPGELDGLHLAELLRQQRPELKIALMSGYGAEYFQDALSTIQFFLHKPFSADELVAFVRQCLGPQEDES